METFELLIQYGPMYLSAGKAAVATEFDVACDLLDQRQMRWVIVDEDHEATYRACMQDVYALEDE